MYSIYADGQVIHHQNMFNDDYVCVDPVIEKSVNAHGSMRFTVPPNHPLYDNIESRKTVITAYDDQDEIFRGRVIECTTDFYNQKEVYAEGEMSFLCDSIIKPFYFAGTASAFLSFLLDLHNEQVDSSRQILLGSVTVSGSVDVNTDTPSNTWDVISGQLVNVLGGYVYIRESGGSRYLDYLEDFSSTASQTIQFGQNLLDLSQYISAANVITCLIPYGAKLEDYEESTDLPNGLKDADRVTLSGSGYVENTSMSAIYGQVWGSKTWDGIDNESDLRAAAEKYLQEQSDALPTITITAVDLHLVDVDIDSIHVGDYVRVYSVPHEIDTLLLCTSQTIDLSNPEASQITLGGQLSTISKAVANLSAIDILAEEVEEALDIDIPEELSVEYTNFPMPDSFPDGVETPTTWSVRLYRYGHVVSIRMNINLQMAYKGSSYTIFTLPERYRPSNYDFVQSYVAQDGNVYVLTIPSSGEVNVFLSNVGPYESPTWGLRQCISFITTVK